MILCRDNASRTSLLGEGIFSYTYLGKSPSPLTCHFSFEWRDAKEIFIFFIFILTDWSVGIRFHCREILDRLVGQDMTNRAMSIKR